MWAVRKTEQVVTSASGSMAPNEEYGVQEKHVGDQDVAITTQNLQYLVRNGVTHIDAYNGAE